MVIEIRRQKLTNENKKVFTNKLNKNRVQNVEIKLNEMQKYISEGVKKIVMEVVNEIKVSMSKNKHI